MDENSQQQTPWQYTTAQDATQAEDTAQGSAAVGVPLPKLPEVSWSASEYVAHEKAAGWYLGVLGSSIAIVAAIYLITSDVIASGAVFFASLIFMIYAGRKPDVKQYMLSENGIAVGDKSYMYGEFKSFSVVEEGAIDSVWLKPLKRFSPIVVMYFAPEDEERIVNVLANFLPHEDRELDFIDRFSKRIRF